MNIALIMQILTLALGLITNASNGSQNASSITAVLLQILQAGAQLYEQHTGQALDPSLIHVEATV